MVTVSCELWSATAGAAEPGTANATLKKKNRPRQEKRWSLHAVFFMWHPARNWDYDCVDGRRAPELNGIREWAGSADNSRWQRPVQSGLVFRMSASARERSVVSIALVLQFLVEADFRSVVPEDGQLLDKGESCHSGRIFGARF